MDGRQREQGQAKPGAETHPLQDGLERNRVGLDAQEVVKGLQAQVQRLGLVEIAGVEQPTDAGERPGTTLDATEITPAAPPRIARTKLGSSPLSKENWLNRADTAPASAARRPWLPSGRRCSDARPAAPRSPARDRSRFGRARCRARPAGRRGRLPPGNERPGPPGSAGHTAASPPAPGRRRSIAPAASGRWSWRFRTGLNRPGPEYARRSASTAASISREYSWSLRVAASPVEPATTTALRACSQSARRAGGRQASKSISPATVNGVARAVMLPDRCKEVALGNSGAMLLAGVKRRQVC